MDTATDAELRFAQSNQALRDTADRLEKKPLWVDILTGAFAGFLLAGGPLFVFFRLEQLPVKYFILIVITSTVMGAFFFRWLTRYTVRDARITAAMLEGQLTHFKSRADVLIDGDIDKGAVKKYFDLVQQLNGEVARGGMSAASREIWKQIQEIRYNCSDATFAVIQAASSTLP